MAKFELRYLRDKRKREVDFLVVKNHKPWFLLEVKMSDSSLSPALAHFQAQTQAAQAFQLVASPISRRTAFASIGPWLFRPGLFLSQLLWACKQQQREQRKDIG